MTRALPANRVSRDPFALPRGAAGRLAGMVMACSNERAQEAVAERLAVGPGERVLEIGYGPGRLIRRLLETTPAARVAGVDPSGVMLLQAGKQTRRYARTGRLELRLGVAENIPWPDASFERAVTVNTAEVLADVDACLAEMRRVLVRGGTALLASHSPTAPGRLQRARALSQPVLDDLVARAEQAFGCVTCEDLGPVVALVARR